MHPHIIIRTLSRWSRLVRPPRVPHLDPRIIITCGMHTEIIVARVGVRRTTPRPPYPNSSSKRRITSSVSGPAVAMWPLCYVPAPTVGPLGNLGTGTAFQVHTLPSNFGVASHQPHHRTFQTLPASYVISNGRAYHGDLRINRSDVEYHNCDLRINAGDLRINVRDVPFIPSMVYVSVSFIRLHFSQEWNFKIVNNFVIDVSVNHNLVLVL